MLGTDIYEIFTKAPRRLVRGRLFKLPFYEVAGTTNFTAESAGITVRSCQKQKEFLKQNQCGIVAQIFLLCGKVREEIFREWLSEPDGVVLSSAAMVTAAKTVQARGKK